MMSDLNEVITEIHSKLDIVNIVSRYVKLKKQGVNFVGLCPFHKEKTPSFVVSPSRQIFHCFGCGASGDVVKFLTMIENIDFKEAVINLSKEAGIEPPKFKKTTEKVTHKDELLSLNDFLAFFFSENITKDVLDYLKKRSLSNETIANFRIGYAPQNHELLLKSVLEKGFTEEILLKSGAFRRNEKGLLYPYFRNRIMFPIFDLENKIVGFSGRSFDGSEPKYLNTSETEIFKKGEILYGLNFSKNDIKSKKSAIVVEGYFDVILLLQEGIKNVVSSMGTSFTSEHAKLLGRFAEKIYFFFDSDLGGRTGAERAIETCSKYELQPMIVVSKNEKDPDEIIIEQGKDEIIRLINNAKDPILFIADFENGKNGLNPQGKSKTVEKLIDVISKIPNRTIIYEYMKEISSLLEVDLKFLIDEYNKMIKGSKLKSKKTFSLDVRTDKFKAIQKIIVQAIIQKPELINKILKAINIESDFEEPFKKIALKAINDFVNLGRVEISLWNDLNEDEFKFASELAFESESLVSGDAIEETIKNFKEYKFYSEEISRLFEEIKNTSDEHEKFAKLKEYQLALQKMKEG